MRTAYARRSRAPRVLDVGAGAGMLSLMCLQHGASHVTLLETNTPLCGLAEQQMKHSAHSASCWTLLPLMSASLQLAAGEEPFDVVVSELIGTMLHSESMATYMWDLVNRGVVRSFAQTDASTGVTIAPIRYMVPSSGVMTARVVRSAHAVGLSTGLAYAPMQTIYNAVYDTSRVSSRAQWNGDEVMRFCLA